MLHRINRNALLSARAMAKKPQAWANFAREAVSKVLTTAHHTLTLFGLSALIVLGLMLLKPELSHQIRAFIPSSPTNVENRLQMSNAMDSPNTEIKPINLPSTEVVTSNKVEKSEAFDKPIHTFDRNTVKQQQWVSNWLSKRYRVAGDAASMLVATTYLTAKETKLDPLLILAVMAIESGFNPFAESPMGAQGLMQVMSKIHHQKFEDFGGVKEALNPHANIRVGALILKDYVTRGGSVEAGLKSYVGAAAFETDSGYGYRVMAEYNRLKEVASGKPLPTQIGTIVNVARPRGEEKAAEIEANNADKSKFEELAAL